jgi:hypothetical protein
MTKRPDLASRVAAAFNALTRDLNAIADEFNTRSDAEPFEPLQQGGLSKRRDDDPRVVSRADKKRKYSAKWYHKYRSKRALDDAADEAEDAKHEADDDASEKVLRDLVAQMEGMVAELGTRPVGDTEAARRFDAFMVKANTVRSMYSDACASADKARAGLAARRKARADARAARFAEIDARYGEDDECDENGDVPPSPNIAAPPGYREDDQ